MKDEQDTIAGFVDTERPDDDAELGIGIWPDVPDDAYHRHTAIGHSGIRNWIEAKKLGRAGTIGSATHGLSLEGRSTYQDRFIVSPEQLDLRTKEGKAAAAELIGDSGKILLKPSEAALVERMYSALMDDSLGHAVLKAPGDNELTVISRFPGFGQLYKCRIDMERKALWDLKTTQLINEEEWLNKVVEYGYANQAEWYLTLYHSLTGQSKRFCFLCVSKREPHNVWMHEVADYQLAFARAWRQDILRLYERYVPEEMNRAAKRKR